MPKFKDLHGFKIGRLTVMSIDGKRKGRYYWKAKCDCGREISVTSYSLCGKRPTNSCGCLQRDICRNLQTKHGMYDTVELMLWNGASRRARAKQLPINIIVSDIKIPTHCPLLGIPIFRIGNKISDNSPSLDRIIPSKGYVKGNVWVISYKANAVKNNCSLAELELLVSNLKKICGT